MTGEQKDMGSDWIRRYRKFSDNYFDGDLVKTSYCLKDVHNLHKWTKIQQNYHHVDFENSLFQKKEIDIDTTAAQACAGGACEI